MTCVPLGKCVALVADSISGSGDKGEKDSDICQELKTFPGGSDNKESACNVEGLGGEEPLEKGMATHSSILA